MPMACPVMNVVVVSRHAALYQAVVSHCSKLQDVKFTHAAPEDPALTSHVQEAEVLIGLSGDVGPLLGQQTLSSVRWVHSCSAGVDRFVCHPKPGFVLTRQGGCFGQHMAEYVLAHIINRERNLFQIYEDQKASLWTPNRDCLQYRLLSTLTVGILGVGDIGRKVATACKGLGMTVWGLTRTPVEGQEKCPDVDHYRQLEDLPELLSHSDYVCGILPSTPESRGLLDGDMLQHCSRKKSVLINIGRGSLVKETTIINAIRQKWLSGAILDVFEKEPLPPDSELWQMPEVVITPHCAATTLWEEAAKLFAENLKLFLEGKELKFVVDWEKGY